jgi:hypothetical protein
MELVTFKYIHNNGWSIESFPKLDSDNTLILIFAAPDYFDNPAPIKELAENYPKSKMIGCSSAGEILGANIIDKSLSVAIICFKKTEIKIVKRDGNSLDDSFKTGIDVAKQLMQSDLKSIFVLSEGLQVNGSELVKGLNTGTNFSKDIVITGGLAGDGSQFTRTWVIYQGLIHSNTTVAVGFYGDNIKIGHSSKAGWDIFGPERHITRSKNNILYELNEQPALELYRKLLGETSASLPASGLFFPLAIRKDENDNHPLVRTILGINEQEQSLIFAGDMPMGYLAQLMRGNFNRLLAIASEAGEIAIEQISPVKATTPLLSIVISCVGRRLLLGERTEEEIESVINTMPAGTQQIGFYSYGELSPSIHGNCDLHNQTITLTIIYESD